MGREVSHLGHPEKRNVADSSYLSSILSKLSKLIDNEIVSEKEIEVKLSRAILRSLGMESNVKFELNFTPLPEFSRLLEDVKESLFDVPHSISSPHFSEKFELEGIVFYHVHTCKLDAEKVERAYSNYLKARKFLDVLPKLKKVVDRFFSGYSVRDGVLRKYEGKQKTWVFFTTMDDLFEDLDFHLKLASKLKGRYSVIVPTEKTPKNFIKFFREHSEDAKRAGLRIWVVNAEDETIDPFIGYPKDLSLIKNFKNPRIASIISSYWRYEVKELD